MKNINTEWMLLKTNIKTNCTLKPVHKNNKDIKIGDVVRLFLYQRNEPNCVDYSFKHTESYIDRIYNNLRTEAKIDFNLIEIPNTLTEIISTCFTINIDIDAEYINKYYDNNFSILLRFYNNQPSNASIELKRSSYIKLNTMGLLDDIHANFKINKNVEFHVDLKRYENLNYVGTVTITITWDKLCYDDLFLTCVLKKDSMATSSLYKTMRVSYCIKEIISCKDFVGTLVNDYLSKDYENLIPPSEITFNYLNILNFVEKSSESSKMQYNKVFKKINYIGIKNTNDQNVITDTIIESHTSYKKIYDPKILTLLEKGDIIICKVGSVEKNKITKIYESYFKILEINSTNIKCEAIKPNNLKIFTLIDKKFQPPFYSILSTTADCIIEIPSQLCIPERKALFESYHT